MGTTVEIQSLLRFLSQDAKIPLSTAMGKIHDLQKASLTKSVQVTGPFSNSPNSEAN